MGDPYLKVVESNDNVSTVIREVEEGESVDVEVGDEVRTIAVTEDIEFGHKLAVEAIEAGETIYKYGVSIGNATQDISPGEWVHAHNVESNYGRGDLEGTSDERQVDA
jgi:altronate dehydratase small subunit